MHDTATLRYTDLSRHAKVGPLIYVIDDGLADAFESASDLSRSASDLLGQQGQIHPTYTVTDYSRLIQGTYGAMGSGLHVKQTSVFRHPVTRGTEVTVAGEIADLYQRGGRDYWVLEYGAETRDRRMLVRHRMTASVDRDDQEQPNSEKTTKPVSGRRPQTPDDGELVGTITRAITTEGEIEFSRQYVNRFDGIDTPPPDNAHTDHEIATALGLPDIIAHSSHYYAWCAELALMHYGPRFLSQGEMHAQFRAPVFPGDELTLQACRSAEHGPHGIDITVHGRDHGLVARAWATVTD